MAAQGNVIDWQLSSTPILNLTQNATSSKGFISHCYAMLLLAFLGDYPCKVAEKWENDVEPLIGDQGETARQLIKLSSLNVSLTIIHTFANPLYTF